MMLDIHTDDDMNETGGILYFISTADILPDVILIPLRRLFFGQFDENDDDVPEYYDTLGFDTENFIVCTGSILMFLTLNILSLIFGEVILGLIIDKCLCRN